VEAIVEAVPIIAVDAYGRSPELVVASEADAAVVLRGCSLMLLPGRAQKHGRI
jgi:hypothetical protein